jgi:hypothetical protein
MPITQIRAAAKSRMRGALPPLPHSSLKCDMEPQAPHLPDAIFSHGRRTKDKRENLGFN